MALRGDDVPRLSSTLALAAGDRVRGPGAGRPLAPLPRRAADLPAPPAGRWRRV